MERRNFDQSYVDKLIAGDPDTEVHFFRYFGELIGIKMRARIREASLIDDIRQETFLRVIRAIRERGIKHPERIGAFINTVCSNVMLEMLRAGRRADQSSEEQPEIRDDAPLTDQQMITDEVRGRVRQVLAGLPQKDRELIRCVFIEEEDKDEVCRRFAIDREYLRVLLHRARQRMRAQLGDARIVNMLIAVCVVLSETVLSYASLYIGSYGPRGCSS